MQIILWQVSRLSRHSEWANRRNVIHAHFTAEILRHLWPPVYSSLRSDALFNGASPRILEDQIAVAELGLVKHGTVLNRRCIKQLHKWFMPIAFWRLWSLILNQGCMPVIIFEACRPPTTSDASSSHSSIKTPGHCSNIPGNQTGYSLSQSAIWGETVHCLLPQSIALLAAHKSVISVPAK